MSFAHFLRILGARAPLILAFAAVSLALGVALTLVLPKRYDAIASVIVDPRSADVLAGTSAAQPAAEKIDNAISTNIDLLASPGVAMRAVETLRLETNPRARELLVGGGPLASLREQAQRLIATLLPDADENEPRSVKEWMAMRLLANVRMNSNRDSRLIYVRYVSSDPQFSADAANALVKGYRAALLELQVGPAKDNTKWLDGQARELKASLEQAEQKLAQYQQRKGIVASDERVDVETSRLNELAAQLAMAQSLSFESEARRTRLREFLAGGQPPGEVAANPVVQQLQRNIAEREAKLTDMSKRLGPNHPQFHSAQTELAQLRTQLGDEMQKAARSELASQGVATDRAGAMSGALEAQRARVLRLKSDRNEAAALMRDVDTAQRAYLAAAQRMSQTQMESQLSSTNGAIVDFATVPLRPASPNVPLVLALAVGAGFVIGIGVALLVEAVTRVVRSEHDIVEWLGVPVLAVLGPRRVRTRFTPLAAPRLQALPGARELTT